MSTKIPTTERFRDKTTYGIYCVNIFGSGLNSIKNEFKRQVRTGLRQPVFVLDLDDIQTELNNKSCNTNLSTEIKENSNAYLINLVLQHVQEFHKDYEISTKKANEELKFDLYQYWLKDNGENKKTIVDKTKNTKSNKAPKETRELQEKYKIPCTSTLISKEHNRQGQSMMLSKRKYIKDEPILDKLYIIILGQMTKLFYKDLLSLDQPLEGIINFVPTESNYDIMLGNNKMRNFIISTLEAINYSIYRTRQEIILKPVGIFTLELPVISNYLATKHSRDIFDQLTWSIYDVDMLKQQYENYYLKPFQLTDVEIPPTDNLTKLYYVAENLSIKNQYQHQCSLTAYLNSLLNTCGLRKDLPKVNQLENLNQRKSFANKFPNSFSTITNISKYGRLVVSENNKLLLNMLQYTDLDKFNSIYLCCLDYNKLGQYAISQQQKSPLTNSNGQSENLGTPFSLTLPQYVKYYATKDCSCQRIQELLNDYEEYEIQEISTGYKLYTFKRKYYVLNENEGSVVIPTRLCFRDFTLFQMEEFLKDLKTPELFSNSKIDIHNVEQKCTTIDLDENIFIRPNSLKSTVLQEERKSEANKSRKSESHSNRSKSERKSSLYKSLSIEEYQGLPPDHHLLKGYNLGDTLQEVKYKNSKYYFHQGFVKLYEEKWCFEDMNKQLSLSINNATLFFSKPRQQVKGILNNIRLVTKNDISIRILNDRTEFPKVVMNYPNGLSVKHHENCCEQIWHCDQTPQNEQRRIVTHFGAVIVFFKSHDMIMILRYNGEVFKLYQHEQAEQKEVRDDISNFGDIDKKSSEMEDIISQGDSLLLDELSQTDHLKKQRVRTKNTLKKTSVDIKKSRYSQKPSSEGECFADMESTTHNLISSINDELNFINLICSAHDLTYLQLVITTSQGKHINLTHQGDIYEGQQCSIKEWHDYFANEAYCERSDGVKMIWSQDSFKCFHKDGTVFTTTIEGDSTEADDDEFEFQISESSSHIEFLEEMEHNETSIAHQQEVEQFTSLGKLISTYTFTETFVQHKASIIQFTRYKCKSWLMQHQNYAEVYVVSSQIPYQNVHMEIFGSDGIRIYIQPQEYIDHNVQDYDYLISESEENMEDRTDKKLEVNLWIGEHLHVKAAEESCNIFAVVTTSKFKRENKSDTLSLSLNYTDYINDAFKYLVNEVAAVANNAQQDLEELYFIEKVNTDNSIRGFEFFTSIPVTSNYKLHVGNTITEIRAVNSLNASVICNTEGYLKDLEKFPRFKEKQKDKNYSNSVNDFPRFVSANVFIEIPKQLLSLTNVTKFLEPFEEIHFKSLRSKFKNVLSLYLEPQQQFYLKVISSKTNWKKRLLEHKRHAFTEKQRLGLYNAMTKHQRYPNYWKFTENYGSEVRRIEFFDFMQSVCSKKVRV